MPDRLLVDLAADGQDAVSCWPDGEFPHEVSRAPLAWRPDGDVQDDLNWSTDTPLDVAGFPWACRENVLTWLGELGAMRARLTG